jgi:hypothetical protein
MQFNKKIFIMGYSVYSKMIKTLVMDNYYALIVLGKVSSRREAAARCMVTVVVTRYPYLERNILTLCVHV